MVSLQDASRRLQVPVEVLWKWIKEGRLTPDVQTRPGQAVEYYLDSGGLKKARELRDEQVSWEEQATNAQDVMTQPPDNVITLGFSKASEPTSEARRGNGAEKPPYRGDAVIALENLRAEALAAIERQHGRETAILELAAAVETIMNTMLEAMDQAQRIHEGKVAADLETIRVRLARQMQDRERDDLRLRDQLAETKTALSSALRTMSQFGQFVPVTGNEAKVADRTDRGAAADL